MRATAVATVQASLVGSARREILAVERCPARVACDAAFIADPAHIGTGVAEDAGVGLKLAHNLPGVGPIVVGLAINLSRLARSAVIAISSVSAVKEYFKNGSVRGQQLAQLIAKIGDVFRPAIIFVVTVPRREVYAEFDCVLSAGVGNLFYYIAAPSLPRALFDGVPGLFRWPETEPIVMLTGE